MLLLCYTHYVCCCCCCCCCVTSIVSAFAQPHRRQPTRLPCPWDSPGRNTGVSCHFLLQCMKVKSESEDAQSCPTLRDPMDCSLPGSSVHEIFQARVLEWVAIAFSEYVCKFAKLSGHRTRKYHLSFQPQRSTMPKSVKILFHFTYCFHFTYSKSFKLGFSSHGLRTSRCTSWVSKRQRNQRSTFAGSWKTKGVPEKTSALLIMLKPSTLWITTNCGKYLNRWEYQITLPVF